MITTFLVVVLFLISGFLAFRNKDFTFKRMVSNAVFLTVWVLALVIGLLLKLASVALKTPSEFGEALSYCVELAKECELKAGVLP